MAGVIDSGYRNEIKVLLINESSSFQTIYPKDKIAQMLLQHSPDFTPIQYDELDQTSRGLKGFGSSGE
jgi:dUTP pyrophosphatase